MTASNQTIPLRGLAHMKTLCLLLAAGTLAGGVFSLGKLGAAVASPLTLLLWQVVGGAMLLWLGLLVTGQRPPWSRAHLLYYSVAGLLGVTAPFALAYSVLREIPVGLIGLFAALSPLCTYALARVLGREQGNRGKLAGLLVSLAGIALIVVPAIGVAPHWGSLLLGALMPLVLAASNLYRAAAWPAGTQPLPLAAGMLSAQTLLLLPLALLRNEFNVPGMAPGSALIGGALMVIAGFSYLTAFQLLRSAGPVHLSMIGYVITTVTMTVGIVGLGEQYSARHWLAVGLVLAGLLLANRPAPAPGNTTVATQSRHCPSQ